MKLAVAHRQGYTQPTDLNFAQAITLYRRHGNGFQPFETRPIPEDASIDRWLELLRDCHGLMIRTIPPRIALELQRHQIFPLSGTGFGPNGLNEALEFLASCLIRGRARRSDQP